jgi:hypothetical protein
LSDNSRLFSIFVEKVNFENIHLRFYFIGVTMFIRGEIMKKEIYINKKFGRITIIDFFKNEKKEVLCKCICDCGNVKNINWQSLKRNITLSCGCLRNERVKEKNSTHGMSNTSIYDIWSSMISRCKNINNKFYKNYGGRNIGVCKSWESFENFYEDMGNQPFEKAQLDRIDNDKEYNKENCRWVTKNQNNSNRGSFKNKTSNYKGVYYDRQKNKWKSCIRINGKTKHLGYFEKEIDAAAKYNEHASIVFKEYAYLNKF